MGPAMQEERPGLISNILAIVGFLIVIVIVIWGLFHLAQLSKSLLPSMFGSKKDTIAVTVPSSPVPTGKPVTISWKYNTNDAGAYAFLYQCRTGFQFKTKGTNNSSNSIPCGAAFTVQGTTNSLSVTPEITGATSVSIPLSIIFVPSATTSPRAQGSASITVIPASSSLSPLPSTSKEEKKETVPAKTPAKPTTRVSVETGLPDLSVRVISYGVIDPISGDIFARYPTSPNDLAEVTFDIANVGTASSGTWYFTALIPTSPAYTYNSPAQNSLTPGAHIENMLRFTQVAPGNNIFTIIVDPSNQINESNKANNVASQNI